MIGIILVLLVIMIIFIYFINYKNKNKIPKIYKEEKQIIKQVEIDNKKKNKIQTIINELYELQNKYIQQTNSNLL